MSYEELVNRYKDLFTPEFIETWDEAGSIDLGDGAEPTEADRTRARELRTQLQERLVANPCECDCYDEVSCECRRCRLFYVNERRLAALSKRIPARARTRAQKPSPPAATAVALAAAAVEAEAQLARPAASRRSIAALMKKVYLAVGVDGNALNTWLVNETARALDYTVRTGESSDGLASGIAERGTKTIPARSTVLFEADTIYGLESSVWWQVRIVGRDGRVHELRASRGKYGWDQTHTYVDIPFTDKRGALLRFCATA